jgi:osmotically-inducible protein OsmY
LSGTVKDAAAKDHEVALVRRMRGVKAVNDELRIGHVGPSAAQTVGDAALVAAVEAELTAQAGVNVTTIKVDASAGNVTLSGHAATAAIKSTLVDAARHTPGVRNVVDRIAVK